MVEVQGLQHGEKQQQAKKAPQHEGRLWLWRCGWRCFACTSAVAGCCCCCTGTGSGGVRSAKERALLWVGGVSLTLGLCLAVFWTQLLTLVVHSELQLSPRSTSFRVWRNTPVPLRIDFYFWNWTNPHEVTDPLKKPHFEQMGPYRFRETKEKVNITWNSNGTVSFRQLRRWYFDAEFSNGTLADEVTTLNVVALTAAHVVRDWGFLVRRSVALALRSTNQALNITRTVGQFLFEGFEDPLITIASRVPGLAGIDIPNFDKFGWFYMRNGSTDYDGHFNMDTGALDVARLGELRRWNYNNYTPFYADRCGELRGSAGELFPPGRGTGDRISLFAPDLCRSVSLDYSGRMREAGVDGLRYEGGPLMLDNGQLDGANECFCGGECVAGGVANVSACRYGAPAFVSFPHFHRADAAYRHAVAGMRPSAQEHAFYIALEPTYGIPLDVAARFQINLLVQRSEDIYMLARVPERTMFPVIWFEQRAAITAELATSLRLLLQLPAMLLGAAAALVLGGAGCVVAALLLRSHRRRLRADTLALVASVVAKSASIAHGAVTPTPAKHSGNGQHPAETPPLLHAGAASNRARSLASLASLAATGSALQPLLASASASSGCSSAATSSPVPRGTLAPEAAPEDSSTPEPEEAEEDADDDRQPPARAPPAPAAAGSGTTPVISVSPATSETPATPVIAETPATSATVVTPVPEEEAVSNDPPSGKSSEDD